MNPRELRTYLQTLLNKSLQLDEFPSLEDYNWHFCFDYDPIAEWDGWDFRNESGDILQISTTGRVKVWNTLKLIFESQISI